MSSRAVSRDLGTAALLPFFALTFTITWSLFALFIVAPGPVERLFGPSSGSHPLFILAVYAPAISAFLLVLRRAGPGGMVRFLSRLTLWRAPPVWYLMLLAGIPAVYYAGALIKGAPLLPPFESLAAFLGLLAFMAVLGPVEEFGWRGVALPLLQRRMVPFAASVVLGLVWALWHLPAFLLSGTLQSNWQFMPFLLGLVATSVIMTQLFNASRGSIVLPMLFHWQLNNPAWPDAQPWDTGFFVAAAAVVTWACRGRMFTRAGAATEVVPEHSRSAKEAAEGL